MNTLYAIASRFAGPGIGRTASHAALGLWRAGYLKRLVCLGHEPTEIPEDRITDVRFFRRGMLRFLPDKTFFEMKNRWFDRTCQKTVEPNFDTVHTWNSQAPGALEQAHKQGLRTVVDRASSHIRTQTAILRREYARFGLTYNPTYAHVIERCEQEYEMADLIVTPSAFAYRSFEQQGVDMGKVVFNPFGVDLERFAPQRETPEDFQVLFAGQVGIRKGVPTLLAAWDLLRLPDATLVVAGPVEPVAQPLFRPYRDREDVVFLGSVPDIREWMEAASVFAFPSCEEGSALVTYEAMASALPVVTTLYAGSVVEHGVSGFLVDPQDVEELAAILEKLYRDRQQARQIGLAARKRVESFGWSDYGDRTARLHEALATGSSIDAIHASMGISPPVLEKKTKGQT